MIYNFGDSAPVIGAKIEEVIHPFFCLNMNSYIDAIKIDLIQIKS